MGEDKPSQLRDELKRRRELREAQLQEGTPVRLVGRYPAPVAVGAEAVAPVPPAISLEVPVSRPTPPRRKTGPGGLMIALMLVPAVVALVSTSLLLYVLLLERHPDLFASNEGETVQAAEEEETERPSRFKVSPRSGFAPSGAKRTAPEPEPRPEPQPETAAIDIAAQQRAVQLQLGQIAPPSQPQQGVAPTTAPATVAPVQQAAPPPPPPPPPQAQMAAPPAQTPPPQAQQAAPPIQRVPPEIAAQWGDPGLQPAQTGAPAVPQDAVLLLLIRSSLLALHRSNMTGNYQSLHGISSIPFQNVNPPPKLFQVFANLRQRGVDLSPAMFVQPKLIRKPEINQRGVLRVSGFFPTDPERIYFDLKFLRGPQGRWRLFGITVDKLAPKPAAQTGTAAPAGAAQPAAAQLGPAEATPAPAAEPEPQASAPAPQGAPPLPTRKPAGSAAGSSSEVSAGETEEATAGTAPDVYDQVDDAEAQEPQQKRFWPFRRKEAE